MSCRQLLRFMTVDGTRNPSFANLATVNFAAQVAATQNVWLSGVGFQMCTSLRV